MLLLLKNKAWEKRRVLLLWENTHIRQISADHHTKEDGPKEEFSILQYNLDDQVQKQYQDMFQEGYNTLCWYCHTEYKYHLDTPDSGVGNQIRFLFVVYLGEWIWDYGNFEQ